MKITAVTPHPFSLAGRGFCLVKVETDAGVSGWGEAGLASRGLAVIEALRHLGGFLVGRDPQRPGMLWQEVYRGQFFEGGRVLTAALGAIDIALHDLLGHARAMPVHALLGGAHRDRVPCFASSFAGDVPTLLEHGRSLQAAGFDCIRTFPFPTGDDPAHFDPRASLGPTARGLAALREDLGPDIALGIDWHQRLDPAQAASFAARLPAGTLDFIEDPVRSESPAAAADLRRQISIPVATGEALTSKWAFAPMLEMGAMDHARIDLPLVGGFTEAVKIAALAETRYIPVMPHNPLSPLGTAATVHFAAACPLLSWVEVRESPAEPPLPGIDEVFPDRPALGGPSIAVPDGPGLGIVVNEAWLRAHRYIPAHTPRLQTPDGAFTNW